MHTNAECCICWLAFATVFFSLVHCRMQNIKSRSKRHIRSIHIHKYTHTHIHTHIQSEFLIVSPNSIDYVLFPLERIAIDTSNERTSTHGYIDKQRRLVQYVVRVATNGKIWTTKKKHQIQFLLFLQRYSTSHSMYFPFCYLRFSIFLLLFAFPFSSTRTFSQLYCSLSRFMCIHRTCSWVCSFNFPEHNNNRSLKNKKKKRESVQWKIPIKCKLSVV